jgi:hypothetical protein
LMWLSTGFCAPGKDLVMSFITNAYWAAMGSRCPRKRWDLVAQIGEANALC